MKLFDGSRSANAFHEKARSEPSTQVAQQAAQLRDVSTVGAVRFSIDGRVSAPIHDSPSCLITFVSL
jgi:hypothetical protein